MKAHLQAPRSRSSAKVKVKYQGHVSQKMGVSGALVFHKHILFEFENFHIGVPLSDGIKIEAFRPKIPKLRSQQGLKEFTLILPKKKRLTITQKHYA